MKDGINVQVTAYGRAIPMTRAAYCEEMNPKLAQFDVFDLLCELSARGTEQTISNLKDFEWLRFDIDMEVPVD